MAAGHGIPLSTLGNVYQIEALICRISTLKHVHHRLLPIHYCFDDGFHQPMATVIDLTVGADGLCVVFVVGCRGYRISSHALAESLPGHQVRPYSSFSKLPNFKEESFAGIGGDGG
ncbi:hypothetical protein ACLOJK_004102 [Asimina triloba]